MKSRVLLSLAAVAGVCLAGEAFRRIQSSMASPSSAAHREGPMPVRVAEASTPPHAEPRPSHPLQRPANHPTKQPESELTTGDLPANRLLRELEAGLKTYDPGNSAGFFTLLS